MLPHLLPRLASRSLSSIRLLSTTNNHHQALKTCPAIGGPPRRVCITGAATELGALLAMLLKQSPMVSSLVLSDSNPCGLAMDISHIDTTCVVEAFAGDDCRAMTEADIVIVCPQKSRATRGTMASSAAMMSPLMASFCTACPEAILLLMTSPMNSTVPLAAEYLKKNGKFDWRRVMGVSAVDGCRAATFVSELTALQPEMIAVPVIGGNSEATMVPVLSQTKPCMKLTDEQYCDARRLTLKADAWVKEMRDGLRATLAPAHAAARFTNNVIRGLNGETGVTDCAFINTESMPEVGVKYCALPVELGSKGVSRAKLPLLNEEEANYFQTAKNQLGSEIKCGEDFARKG